MIPVSQAILRETFPREEQGMAMALWGMGVVLAPAIGPILGGWLTDHYGWPWIFYINVPVSIAGILMVATFVHDPHYLRRGVKNIDWLGIALLAVALTSMQIVMERGQQENWFDSNKIRLGTAVCAASFLGLLYWEMKIGEPVSKPILITIATTRAFKCCIALPMWHYKKDINPFLQSTQSEDSRHWPVR